jgi:hypothetical protein
MKPAFTTLKVKPDGSVQVKGPIDLDGTEIEGYFWVRIVQEVDATEVDGVGIKEKTKTQLRNAFKKTNADIVGVVTAVAVRQDPDTAEGQEAIAKRVRDATAMWDAEVKPEKGKFKKGQPADIEAWALVRCENPTRMFHVYWSEKAIVLT